MTPNDKEPVDSDSFSDWLDAGVTGMSSPHIEGGAGSDDLEIRAAARRFHALDQRLSRHATAVSSRAKSWEDVMPASTVSSRTASLEGAMPAPSGRRPPDAPDVASATPRAAFPDRTHPRAWERAASMFLAASILLVVAAGLWRASGGFGDSGDGQSSSSSERIGFAPDPAVWTPEPSDATPASGPAFVELPDASECTIEPLSVDEVLAIADDPDFVENSLERYNEVYRATPANAAMTEGLGYLEINEPPSQETLDELIAVQREWIACSLADSWFQRWALSDPTLVASDVTERLYPTYLSRDEARALLEELDANGTAGDLPRPSASVTGNAWLHLVDPDPARSNQFIEPLVTVGTLTFDTGGNRIVEWAGMLDQDDLDVSGALADREPDRTYLTFIWSEIEGRWLILEDLV